jgi:hypothetical protein
MKVRCRKRLPAESAEVRPAPGRLFFRCRVGQVIKIKPSISLP